MKKTLILMSALAFATVVSLSTVSTASAAEATRKVCHIKKGKEICKELKVRPKSEPLKKPDVKKPAVKKTVKKKKISN